MLKRHTLLCFLLLFFQLFANNSYAQQLEVFDEETNQPLQGATIHFHKSNITLQTGIDGKCSISELELQSDSICIYLIHYNTTCLSIHAAQPLIRIAVKYDFTRTSEVVITADRSGTSKRYTAQQVLTIDQTDIANYNQQNTADLLQQSGEVFVQKSQMGGGSPVLRGFEASRVLMIQDGIRLNNAIYRSGHLQNILTLDQTMAERVEVMFGPGSVLYGSDALGGVINYQSRSPYLSDSFTVRGNAFLRYSNANHERTGHFDMNLGWKRWAILLGGTYSIFDDLRQGQNRSPSIGNWGLDTLNVLNTPQGDTVIRQENSHIQEYTGYHQYDLQGKLLYQQSKHSKHTFNISFSNSNDIPRYDRLVQVKAGKPTYASWYYGPQTRLLTYYRWQHERKHTLFNLLRITPSFQYVEESRHDRRLNSSYLNSRTERVFVYALNIDLGKDVRNHEIRYGAELTYNLVHSSAISRNIYNESTKALSTRYPDGGSNMLNTAFYLNDQFRLNAKNTICAGLRFSTVHLRSTLTDTTFFPFPYSSIKQDHTALSGNITYIFRPGQHWKLASGLNSGFRAPNVDDAAKIFDSSPGKLILPNEKIKPEYTYTGEVAAEYIPNNKLKIEARVFYTWYLNAITLSPTKYNGKDSALYDGQLSAVYTTTNASEGYLYGSYCGIRATPVKALELYSNLTYTYGRINTNGDDQPLDHIPPLYGKTGLVLKSAKLWFDSYIMYNGWKLVEDYSPSGEDNLSSATSLGTPSWYTLNARASIKAAAYVTIQLYIENITDKFYRTFSSGVSSPGRSIGFNVRASF